MKKDEKKPEKENNETPQELDEYMKMLKETYGIEYKVISLDNYKCSFWKKAGLFLLQLIFSIVIMLALSGYFKWVNTDNLLSLVLVSTIYSLLFSLFSYIMKRIWKNSLLLILGAFNYVLSVGAILLATFIVKLQVASTFALIVMIILHRAIYSFLYNNLLLRIQLPKVKRR